jgi:alcohol dehydrogenase (cytochrome c)
MRSIFAALAFCCSSLAFAQTTDELVNDGKNADNVLTLGQGYARQAHSALKQINKSNIKRLVPIWSTSLSNNDGELAQPLVYNGVMYLVNGRWTVAVDIATGRQIWRTAVEFDPAVARAASTGVINRGAAIYNGKLYRATLDAQIQALDIKTGKQVWKQKFAEWKEAYIGNSAPIVANGVVISGMAGGDRGARGFLDGWDAETGKKLWRRYTVPGPGEPGFETWPQGNEAYKYGGGATWLTGSYDPQLDLVFWGTGNAATYNPENREGKDSLYTAAVIAIRPKTGEMVWYYQHVPNDSYDYDSNNEYIQADMRIDGQMRKVLINAHKNAFMYVLDRTNGKVLRAHPYEKMNWATRIDLASGRPVLSDIYQRLTKGEEVELWPSPAGARNWAPMAYSPVTGLAYMNTWHQMRWFKFEQSPVVPDVNVGHTGAQQRNPVLKPGEVIGYHLAFNPLTGETKWRVPFTDMINSSGMLSTEGGLLFTGKLSGEFIALDEASGKTVWQFQTGSSINAPPITYTHKGRQYVSVTSGIGGSHPRRFAGSVMPTGGSVWTFALLPD